MRVLVIFASLIAAVYAGSRVITDARDPIAIEAKSLWDEYCKDPNSNGRDGVWCKGSNHPVIKEIKHTDVAISGQKLEQKILVKPPSYHFTHNIDVKGDAGFKTKVFVFPPKIDHKYNGKGSVDTNAPKPSIYYLTNEHNPTDTQNRPESQPWNAQPQSQSQQQQPWQPAYANNNVSPPGGGSYSADAQPQAGNQGQQSSSYLPPQAPLQQRLASQAYGTPTHNFGYSGQNTGVRATRSENSGSQYQQVFQHPSHEQLAASIMNIYAGA